MVSGPEPRIGRWAIRGTEPFQMYWRTSAVPDTWKSVRCCASDATLCVAGLTTFTACGKAKLATTSAIAAMAHRALARSAFATRDDTKVVTPSATLATRIRPAMAGFSALTTLGKATRTMARTILAIAGYGLF